MVSFTSFCSSWLVCSTRRISSSTEALRSTMVVRWSVRTSLSNTQLTPELREITSNTPRSGTSRTSSEIGWALSVLRRGVAIAGLAVFSSITRCRRRASRFCGFSTSTGRSTSCASRYFSSLASRSAAASTSRWRASSSS